MFQVLIFNHSLRYFASKYSNPFLPLNYMRSLNLREPIWQ